MDLKLIAFILLAGRLVSVYFMALVLKRQLELNKTKINPLLSQFRSVIFLLAIVIFVGNLIPITIDTLSLFANVEGRQDPAPIGVAYAFSNCITSITASYLIWTMYRQSAKIVLITDRNIEIALAKKIVKESKK